jgi:hypothetical protein
MFKFKITLSDDDYLLFNQYHLLNSPSGKKYFTTIKFIVPFICFMFLVIFYIAGSDFELILFESILMTIMSICWIGFNKRLIIKSMNKKITKMKKEGKLPYSNEAILTFDNENIHEITPNSESVTNYSLIEKIIKTEKAIYIHINTVQAFILPVTAFSDEMEKQNFLEFINRKVDILSDTKQV